MVSRSWAWKDLKQDEDFRGAERDDVHAVAAAAVGLFLFALPWAMRWLFGAEGGEVGERQQCQGGVAIPTG